MRDRFEARDERRELVDDDRSRRVERIAERREIDERRARQLLVLRIACGEARRLGAVEIHPTADDQIELGAETLEKRALLIELADRDFRATLERDDRITVDACGRRIAIDEQWKHAEGVPLMRKVHLDA